MRCSTGGGYRSIAELELVFRDMVDGMGVVSVPPEADQWVVERRQECMTSVTAGGGVGCLLGQL